MRAGCLLLCQLNEQATYRMLSGCFSFQPKRVTFAKLYHYVAGTTHQSISIIIVHLHGQGQSHEHPLKEQNVAKEGCIE